MVSDARAIRTGNTGSAVFTRGSELVTFGPRTEAGIIDRGGHAFTTVVQQSGTIGISADVRRVRHFAVETPYLVAVVKGTVFTVETGPRRSRVAVSRGLVAVTERLSRHTFLIPAGQSIATDSRGRTSIAGTPDPARTHSLINGVVEDDTAAGLPGGGVLGEAGALVDGLGTAGGGLLDSAVTATGNLVGQGLGAVGGAVDQTLGGGLPAGDIISDTGGLVSSTGTGLGTALGGTLSGVGGAVGSVAGSSDSGSGLVGRLGL